MINLKIKFINIHKINAKRLIEILNNFDKNDSVVYQSEYYPNIGYNLEKNYTCIYSMNDHTTLNTNLWCKFFAQFPTVEEFISNINDIPNKFTNIEFREFGGISAIRLQNDIIAFVERIGDKVLNIEKSTTITDQIMSAFMPESVRAYNTAMRFNDASFIELDYIGTMHGYKLLMTKNKLNKGSIPKNYEIGYLQYSDKDDDFIIYDKANSSMIIDGCILVDKGNKEIPFENGKCKLGNMLGWK